MKEVDMLEYGIKAITTNPTLITKAEEVIRLVDSRNHRTRAFVIPAIYEEDLKDFFKEIAYKKWVHEKKEALKKEKIEDTLPEELMEEGWKNIGIYLDEKR
jgi:type III secretory pathway component EscR